jgi:predicted nucleic acid-binding Zn ribbon protein
VSGSDLPHRLKDLLGGVGARIGLEDARATGMLWEQWPSIVGDAIAGNAEPTSLRKGILRVRATSPTWAQELTYLAAEIKARANAITGSEIVTEVRVWTGPGEVARATPDPAQKPHDGSGTDAQEQPQEASPENLEKAFLRARGAWARRRSKPGR